MPTPALILAAAAQAETTGGLPQLNPENFAPQLIWLAITYGVLYVALSWFILPRIGQVIDERRSRIQRDLDEAERLRKETEAAIASYEQALAEARNKASSIAKETREKLGAETERERARVEETINAKLAEAERRIEATKTRAMAEVETVVADTAGEIASKLLGTDVSPDDVRSALAAKAAE